MNLLPSFLRCFFFIIYWFIPPSLISFSLHWFSYPFPFKWNVSFFHLANPLFFPNVFFAFFWAVKWEFHFLKTLSQTRFWPWHLILHGSEILKSSVKSEKCPFCVELRPILLGDRNLVPMLYITFYDLIILYIKMMYEWYKNDVWMV